MVIFYGQINFNGMLVENDSTRKRKEVIATAIKILLWIVLLAHQIKWNREP